MSNFTGKVLGLITLNISRTARAMSMNFCIVNASRCQILILGCKVFRLFQQIFAGERAIPKNALHCKIKFPPLLQPSSSPLSYSDVIRVKMLVLKHWVFLEDVWNFNKWKSLNRNERFRMLCKTMLRETIVLLPK